MTDAAPQPPGTTRLDGESVPSAGWAWAVAIRIVIVAIAVVVALWLLVTLRGIVLEVLVAVILASGLRPPVERLHRSGVPRGAAVLLIYAGFIILVALFGVLVVPPVLDEINDVILHAPEYGDWASQWLADLQQRFPSLPPLDQQLAAQVRGLGSQIGALAAQALVVARFALSVFSTVASSFLLLLITLYLIVDGPRIREYFLSFLDPSRRERVRSVADRIGVRMGGWLLGQLTLSASVGAVTFVGLSVLGVPGAVLLALVAAVGEAIPMVGPILSAVPAILVALTQSPLLALLTAVMYLGVQQVENNFLVPRIMGRAVELHPLAVVLSLLVGAELMGVPGAIVAVPVAAAISVLLDEVRSPEGSDRAPGRAAVPSEPARPAPPSRPAG